MVKNTSTLQLKFMVHEKKAPEPYLRDKHAVQKLRMTPTLLLVILLHMIYHAIQSWLQNVRCMSQKDTN